METKRFTQYGIFQIIIFGILIVLFSLKSYDLGFLETSGLIYAGLSALALLCVLLMYKIVMEIDENRIFFKFGIGLFRRSYQVTNVIGCVSVRCSLLNEFGIRKIANGWLYNISGVNAIELRLEDTKSVIRIGINKSSEIASLVSDLIKKPQDTNEFLQIENTSSIDWGKWIGSVVVLIAILSFFYINKNDAIIAKKDKLDISGIYSKSIDYSQIIRIDTISVMPEIELRTDGSSFRSLEKGYFTLKDVGDAYLNLNLKYPPFIRIILTNNNYIFLNLCDAKETKYLFKDLKDRILENAK